MKTPGQSTKLQRFLSRLRELEAESLRLSKLDYATELLRTKTTYEERLEQLELSHSHSWFGDHSSTYFQNFESPPPGRSFDVEWGFIPGWNGARNSGWRTYSRDEIRDFVFRGIGENILGEIGRLAEDLTQRFSIVRDQALDVLEALSTQVNSKASPRYAARIQGELEPYSVVDFVNSRLKSASAMTRDSEEIAKGRSVPAHIQWLGPLRSIAVNKTRSQDLASVLRNAIEATALFEPTEVAIGAPSKVFIGHGRSEQWRTLKDFIRDRLQLPYEEFNRISPAGISTQERLTEMLDQCGFASMVLAAEDLHGDGSMHARENVIHEAGLFQGRLGWRRAIIVLEEGCEEFSNIVGIGQIRFKGKIDQCFEDVRRVLEREQLLAS